MFAMQEKLPKHSFEKLCPLRFLAETMVAMKYVENPMLMDSRKFDIRIWVLITGWDPITAWAYTETYGKLASEEYDPNSKN